MIIKPDNEMLSYSGRIDFDDRLAPVLVYACSSIGMKFTGTSLKAVIANHRSCWTNELGYFIDGEQKCFTLSSDEEKKTYTLAEGLSEGTHELLLFKRMDSCHTFTFYGFEIDDGAEVLPLPEKPKRKWNFLVTVFPVEKFRRLWHMLESRILSMMGNIRTAGIPMRG